MPRKHGVSLPNTKLISYKKKFYSDWLLITHELHSTYNEEKTILKSTYPHLYYIFLS